MFGQNLLLGGTSGIIAKTICAPLERIKIILQVQSSQAVGSVKYNGIVDAAVSIAKNDGLLAFWRGNFTNCLRYFPTQAMNFAFKDKYQALFVRPKEEVGFGLWFAGFLAAGGAAGATALTVSYPLEYTFTRLAADTGVTVNGVVQKQYNGIVDCIAKSVQSDGIRGIYRGYGPSVAGIIVYRAGYFGLYDSMKLTLGLGYGKDAHSAETIAKKFVLALGVDIFSAMIAYPLDTVRRSMMMMSGRKDKLYTNSFQAFSHIWKEGGIKYAYCLIVFS